MSFGLTHFAFWFFITSNHFTNCIFRLSIFSNFFIYGCANRSSTFGLFYGSVIKHEDTNSMNKLLGPYLSSSVFKLGN